MKKVFLFFLFFQSASFSFSQGIEIGSWRSHVNLSDIKQVVDANDKIFCVSGLGLFSVDKTDHSYQQFSKANGLNDVGISCIAWNKNTQSLIVAYNNSNIDIIGISHITNISDIKNKSIPGNKSINKITIDGVNAYLSCGFGIVKVNVQKLEIEDTYLIGPNGTNTSIKNIVLTHNKIWALTSSEIKYAALSSNLLSNYAVWNSISAPFQINEIASIGDSLFIRSGDSIFTFNKGLFHLVFNQPNKKILWLKESNNHLLFSTQNSNNDSCIINVYTASFKRLHTFSIQNYSQNNTDAINDLSDNSYWFTDLYVGLFRNSNKSTEHLTPNSIHYNSAQYFSEKNNELWVAGGSLLDGYHYSFSATGFYSFINEEWNTIDRYSKQALDTVYDLVSVAISPSENKIYFGSFGWGLVEYNKDDGAIKVFKKNNSTLSNVDGDPNSIRVSDVQFDSENNLWMNNYGATNAISVKKATGEWKSFKMQANTNNFGKLIIDKNNQLWMTTHEVGGTTGGGGLFVFSRGDDIDNTADDKYRSLVKGSGYGNLPSNNVFTMAEDKDGQIWVGTDVGVAVFSNPSEIIKGGDAEQIIVSNPNDSIAAYLFSSEVISDIKVDGANRKWIASTHGVWLMSADGTKEIYHFSEENSPLLSDRVNAIGINNTTGEVFFATENGICSFKSSATGGGEKNEKVLVYPNPVPHNFSGTIAIRGLVDNAFVKITDINGQLIYSTKALGGQAVWDGKNLSGEKTATGVYLVFCTNEEGSETTVAKILYEK
ncbi:MAG: hypothetical protein RL065_1530 [Bacteroidota bacterium]